MSIEGHGHLHMKIKTGFSQKPLGHFNQILRSSFQVHERKMYLYNANHMTKMADIPIFGKKKL